VRRAELLISTIALAVIVGGARYAVGREQLRRTDLQAVYHQINHNSFDGALPEVPVAWRDLGDDEYGETDYGSVSINWKLVTTNERLRETMQHEMCHISVGAVEKDIHGSAFETCVQRFPKEYR
jgi:predicted SprT family Zn-dependent metalloprotease